MRNDLKIAFFGTPEFGKIILERLIESGYKAIFVITQPDQPVGRKQIMTPPPVKILAEQHKISVFQPKNLGESKTKKLKTINYNLAIAAAYGKIIPKEILDIPKYGSLNVHPSLLPRWRGPSPIQYTILSGDKETGVTIMLMDEKVDHGPIVAQQKLNMLGSRPTQPRGVRPRLFNAGELTLKLANLGAELLVETIPKWVEGKIKPKEQDDKKATYTTILTKEAGRIDWTKSAEEIERQIRAFNPWPGTFTFWQDRRIKILKGHILKYAAPKAPFSDQVPGKVFLCNLNQLGVQTGNGIFVIDVIQLEGKRAMTSKQFLNGYSDIIGTKFGA